MRMHNIVDGDLTELIEKIKETSQLVQSSTAPFLSTPRVNHTNGRYYGDRTENVPKSTLRTLEHRYIDVMKAFRFGELKKKPFSQSLVLKTFHYLHQITNHKKKPST